MLDEIAQAVRDWRYPAGVIFFGPLLGAAIYRVMPAPKGVALNFVRALRARAAGQLAERVGANLAGEFAAMVGAGEMATAIVKLRRQRRRIVLGTTLVAALVLAPVYAWVPMSKVPPWAFVVLGAVGAYKAWRSW